MGSITRLKIVEIDIWPPCFGYKNCQEQTQNIEIANLDLGYHVVIIKK